ncbi:MAG TPA: neocarzinostatin apoprotein domain-containing protein [Iamia sp.]
MAAVGRRNVVGVLTSGGGRDGRADRPSWVEITVAVMALVTGAGLIALAGWYVSVGGMGDPASLGKPGGRYRIDGLAVSVAPVDGLADGSRVTVSSDTFRPLGVVEVMPCAHREQGRLDRCDHERAQRFAVSADGHLSVEVAVARLITIPREQVVDCGERPGRCALVAADVNDRDVSGGAELTFADAAGAGGADPSAEPAPRVPATATVAPQDVRPVVDPVVVTAPGFVPGEPVAAGLCATTDVDHGRVGRCEAIDRGEAAFDSELLDEIPADPTIATAGPDGVATLDVVLPPGVPYRTDRLDCTAVAACVVVVVALADVRRIAVGPVTLAAAAESGTTAPR